MKKMILVIAAFSLFSSTLFANEWEDEGVMFQVNTSQGTAFMPGPEEVLLQVGRFIATSKTTIVKDDARNQNIVVMFDGPAVEALVQPTPNLLRYIQKLKSAGVRFAVDSVALSLSGEVLPEGLIDAPRVSQVDKLYSQLGEKNWYLVWAH